MLSRAALARSYFSNSGERRKCDGKMRKSAGANRLAKCRWPRTSPAAGTTRPSAEQSTYPRKWRGSIKSFKIGLTDLGGCTELFCLHLVNQHSVLRGQFGHDAGFYSVLDPSRKLIVIDDPSPQFLADLAFASVLISAHFTNVTVILSKFDLSTKDSSGPRVITALSLVTNCWSGLQRTY